MCCYKDTQNLTQTVSDWNWEELVKGGQNIQTHADSYISSYRAAINGVRSKGFSRTIPFPSADRMHYRPRSIGVFVGDSIHWCALHSRNADPYEHVDAIDIVSNTYHQLQCPDYNFGETSFVTFNLDP
ncbi:hypothetical protein LINPERHAP1_LOCUS7955 [Linum perenne]